MKTCRDCLIEKDLEDFPTKKSGYVYPYCNDCKRIRHRVYAAAYNERNRQLVNEKARRYRQEHKDDEDYIARTREYNRRQRERSREQHREYMRIYKLLNRERMTHHQATRRARSKNAEGSFTFEEWVEVCGLYDNVCLSCREPKPLTIDHVKPLAQGGSNWITNIQPLCKECNSVKGNKEIDYRLG